MKDKLVPADLNYEAEYQRLLDEMECRIAHIKDLKCRNERLEKDIAILKSQLDIVYLIFGGK